MNRYGVTRLLLYHFPTQIVSRIKMVSFNARGLICAVFTPVFENLSVNYGAIPAYAQYVKKSGIKTVLVGGTTGEHVCLSVAERKKVIEAWVKEGKTTGLHIQVHVGGAPLPDVTELAKYCVEVGADSLLTLPELYFKPRTVDELVSYVSLVAQAAPSLPVLYYHNPNRTKVEVNMPAFVASASARIPNFKGIKYASNDLSEIAQVLRNLKDDQELFLGTENILAAAALMGVRSFNTTSMNLFPQLTQDILAAVEANDLEKARLGQEKLNLAVEAHTVEGEWVPSLKAGMEIVTGIKVGSPLLPQRPISAEAKKRIEGKLRNLKLVK